jgi:plastocyanin
MAGSSFQPKVSFAMASLHRLISVAVAASLAWGLASAAEPEVSLVIKGHRFEPAEIKVPAGQRIKLVVHNQDSTPEEFESHSLNREKVIPGGAKATIFIGPLKPGRYTFFGEYNEATAKGAVVAR